MYLIFLKSSHNKKNTAAELKRAWAPHHLLKLVKLKKNLSKAIPHAFTHCSLWKPEFSDEKTGSCYLDRQEHSLIISTTIREATDSQQALFLPYLSKFLMLLPNFLLNDCPRSYSNIFCSCRKLFISNHPKISGTVFSLSTNRNFK